MHIFQLNVFDQAQGLGTDIFQPNVSLSPILDKKKLDSFIDLPFHELITKEKVASLIINIELDDDSHKEIKVEDDLTDNSGLVLGGGINFNYNLKSPTKRLIKIRPTYLLSSRLVLIKQRTDTIQSIDDSFKQLDIGLPLDPNLTLVSIPFIPSSFTIHQLLLFLDPYLIIKELNQISIVSIKEDEGIRVYAGLKFKEFDVALDFYNHFNGQPFVPNKSDYCFVLFAQSMPIISTTNSELSKVTPSHQYALPSCSYCLLRLDESISGLRNIPTDLDLSKLTTSCSICSLNQVQPIEKVCEKCHNSTDLWICLICNYLGCGRYNQAHARLHSEKFNHPLALELCTGRIWDYLSDTYVHRIINSQTNGINQQVDLISDQLSNDGHKTKGKKKGEKDFKDSTMESLILQLYNQYLNYSTQLQTLITEEHSQSETITNLNNQLKTLQSQSEINLKTQSNLSTTRTFNSKKLKKLNKSIHTHQKKKDEEQAINSQLKTSYQQLAQNLMELNKEEIELKDQIDDLKVYLKASKLIKNQFKELKGGSLALNPTP